MVNLPPSPNAVGISDILTAVQQGVAAINGLITTLKVVATASSSGAVTIHLTQVSS